MANERAERAGEIRNNIPAVTLEYRPDHPGLNEREHLVLQELAEVAREIGKVYAIQQYYHHYPPKVSNETIIEEATNNPAIFDPYTRVEKGPSGKLITIPYHEAYGPYLSEAVKSLKRAASFSEEPFLSRHLDLTAKNLLDGNYEESERNWLTMPETNVDIKAGPYDRYKDIRFRKKFSYSAHVGSLDKEETLKHQLNVDALLDSREKLQLSSVPIVRPVVRSRADITETTGGLTADMRFTANSYPCQSEWREKWGNKIVTLEPAFYDMFNRIRLPIARQIMAQEYSRSQRHEDLFDAYRLRFDVHEASHTFIRRYQDEERFGNSFTYVNELGATAIGLAHLPAMGATAKQLDGVLAMQLAITADGYKSYLAGHKERLDYLRGDVNLLNYLLKERVITIESDGKYRRKDIREVYERIYEFAKFIEKMLTYGGKNDADKFKRSLESFSGVSRFAPFMPPRGIVTARSSNLKTGTFQVRPPDSITA